ncbi:hypothetical protein ANN_08365 [Periplaneta americana]|uniref:Reverse transcriptase domain-containing protein n=1 Tax=Periplaneta americana TaxID=6978 RepID=A0ABQ8T2C7_PERAM|nr:hypothetical protein ANN_08365 [Periplaneta americana]
MSLFVIALNPLLEYLHQSLTGLNLQNTRLTTLSYADDVNILLYNDLEIPRMWQILHKFEEDSGLNINISKSRVLPLGKWENPPHCPPLLITDVLKILDVIYSSNWNKIQDLNWNPIVANIKGKLQTSYPRENCLNNRILILNTYILSLLWYVAQVIPIPMNYSRQLQAAITWYLWKGAIFRVPLSTAIERREEGGLDFIHIPTKCASLLVSRYLKQQTDNIAAKMFTFFQNALQSGTKNDTDFDYVHQILKSINSLQLPNYGNQISTRLIYRLYLETVCNASPFDKPMRIMSYYPQVNWNRVWTNITNKLIPAKLKTSWFKAVHDIYPTNLQLYKIKRSQTMLCSICAQIDTVTHRLTEYNKVKEIWYKIQHIISIWLNTPYTSIQPSMITQPDFHYLPSQKHNAVIWIISNVVFLIMDYNREMEMEEFMEILKRSSSVGKTLVYDDVDSGLNPDDDGAVFVMNKAKKQGFEKCNATGKIQDLEPSMHHVVNSLECLERKVDYLENQNRRNNIVIYGVHEENRERWEETEDLVRRVVAQIGIDLVDSDLRGRTE